MMAQTRILLVDDEPEICWILSRALGELGYEVASAETAEGAVAAFESQAPEVVLLDLRLPDGDGLEVLRRIRELDEHAPVVMMTGHGTIESAVRAMKNGAFDYLIKPVHLEELRVVVEKALETRRLVAEVQTLRAAMRERASPDDLVGASPTMEELRQFIARVAPYDVTILIRGESGTGKELVAHAIHAQSKRRRGPFIPLDCAALPETLVESELFGHERGAFTGATQRRLGRFELAHGGTLFLDEIGNLPLSTQMKLLRVLEDRAISRLGGRGQIPIDVRIVAATHVNFEDAIREGRFREDLYHRLNEFTIHVPALRERAEDIPVLVEHFLGRIGEDLGKRVPGTTPDALAALRTYPWPGNVRELRNALKRAAVLAEGTITLADLPGEFRGRPPAPGAAARAPAGGGTALKDVVRHAVETTERDLIVRTLERTRWNRAQAARILGINYKTLYNKLREYELLREDSEAEAEAKEADKES
ncbi:MAG TPA: sigma-54 dependent transcriptional regulator [Methylomirabilota bacterium]|jgi:DNA-binding NtrC family response regulator|nr:sigma-54 dependent transcriptional regulator [Methylomirabilota bacterium]